MKPEYWALLAGLVPALTSVVLAVWPEPGPRLKVTLAGIGVLGASLAGLAGIWISNEGAALDTGGDSFCYLIYTPITLNPPFNITAIKSGEYPLYGVVARITDSIEPFKPLQLPGLSKPFDVGITLPLGEFSIHDGVQVVPLVLPLKGDRGSFEVFFNARNGFWMEDLRLRLVNGDWKQAVRVYRELPNRKELYKQIWPGFPTEADGTVKW